MSLQRKEERAEAEEGQKAEAKVEDAAVAVKEKGRQDRISAAEIAAASATQIDTTRGGCARNAQPVRGVRRARRRLQKDRRDDLKDEEAGEETA